MFIINTLQLIMVTSVTFYYLLSLHYQIATLTNPTNQMKNKKTIFFVLIPAKDKDDHFAGMLILDCEKLSKQMSEECGGTYVPSSYTLN